MPVDCEHIKALPNANYCALCGLRLDSITVERKELGDYYDAEPWELVEESDEYFRYRS